MKKIILNSILILLSISILQLNIDNISKAQLTVAVISPNRYFVERNGIKMISVNTNRDVVPWINGSSSYCIVETDNKAYNAIDPKTNECLAIFDINDISSERYIPIAYNNGLLCRNASSTKIVAIDSYGICTDFWEHSVFDDSGKEVISLMISKYGILFTKGSLADGLENGDIYLYYHDELIEIDQGYLPFWYEEDAICYLKTGQLYAYWLDDRTITPFYDKNNNHVTIDASPYWTDKILYSKEANCLVYSIRHTELLDFNSMTEDIEYVSLSDNTRSTVQIGQIISTFFLDHSK